MHAREDGVTMFDTSRIHPMLDKVQIYLGKWLEGHLNQIYPTDWWERCVMSVLVPEQRTYFFIGQFLKMRFY